MDIGFGLRPVSAAKALWARLTTGIFSRGAVSLLFATAGVNVSNFLFHIVISRQLGPAHYGAVGSILSILGLLAVPVGACQLAVTQAVIGHLNEGQSFSLSRLIRLAFIVGLVAMLAFLILIPTIDSFLHLTSSLPLFFVAVWIPLASVGAILQGALIGEYRFRAVAFAAFVGGGPVRLFFGVALVSAGFGITGAVIATCFAQAFLTTSLLFSARQRVRAQPHRSVVRTTRRDMAMSIAAITSYTALLGSDTFLARHFFPAAVAGRYAAAAVAAHIALFVPGAIITVAFPHWVSGKGASIASRNAFLQAIRFSALLGLFSAGGLTVLSSLVVHILFGASYIDAASIVGILAFASALLGMLSMFIYFHLARRSFVSLAPWLGVILAVVLIEWHHRSPTSIAVIMLCVIGATLMITALPALLSLAAAKADDAAEVVALIEMPAAEIDFTLVVPFFNPGSQFGKHIKEIVDVLSASGISYEIFAVSDGSTDQSEEQLADIGSEHLTLLRLDQNQGKGAALRLGFSRGRGEYLGFIDGDGDLPAYLLSDLFDILKRENPDIFFGSKRHPRSQVVYPPLRRFYSWGYQQFIRALFHLPVRDTQTGVKVIRRDVLAAVLPRMVEKRFAFDLELFVVARQQGFRNFIEMPVNIGERFTSTISLRSVKNTLLDTLGIFYRLRVLRFYQRDLRGKAEESLVARRSSNVDLFVKENGHRLRILILNWRDINHPNAGGAEVYTHNLAEEWRKEGHDVTLFSAEVHGRPRAEVFEGVSIHRRGSRLSVYREARLFYREEGKGQFDLVIDEINTRPFFAPSWVDDAPVVALVHQVCRELWYYQLPYPLAFLGRYFFEPRWLNAYRDIPTVTVSQSSKESLEAYGLKDVTVVPEGHYPASELPNVPREECPTIVFVGRLEANKRPEEAIQAFALLRETMPTAVLWVIGTGSTEDKLRLSAPEGVKFFSKVSSSEKTERLARAHALVVTSVREGWGLVVTEAAAVGTATIAYDVPGLRDSVRASGGILTAPDPTSLAMELEKYLPLWIAEGMPFVSVGGVVPWSEVAQRILDVAASNFPHVGIQEGLRTRDEL